jgi:hypothetical protein
VQSQQWFEQQVISNNSNNQWPNNTNPNDSSPNINNSNWLNPSQQNDDNLGQSISSNTSVNNNNNNNSNSNSNWQSASVITSTTTTSTTANRIPIEPVGWEEPEFKIAKKSDDGTSIWGDPESQKAAKVAKWTNFTRHVPNPQTIRPPLLNEQEQSSQQYQTQSSITSISSPLSNIPPSSILTQQQQQQQQQQNQAQWSNKPSQWTNTPAAPSLMNDPDVAVKIFYKKKNNIFLLTITLIILLD